MEKQSKHLLYKLPHLQSTIHIGSASWSISRRDIQLYHLQLCYLVPALVKVLLVLEMCHLQEAAGAASWVVTGSSLPAKAAAPDYISSSLLCGPSLKS